MERDVALNFLQQLGGAVGANPMGAGIHDPLSGAPAAGRASLAAPGLAGVGGWMAAAGPMGAGPGMTAAAGPMAAVGGPMGGLAGPGGELLNGGGLLQMGLGGGDMLSGSAFSLNRETRQGGILSFWSRGAQSQFAGREGALSLGGAVRTTMAGADYAKGPLVTGLSLSHSRGLSEYAGVTGGQVASSVTGLYPWLGYKATDRITVWGVGGGTARRAAADARRRAGAHERPVDGDGRGRHAGRAGRVNGHSNFPRCGHRKFPHPLVEYQQQQLRLWSLVDRPFCGLSKARGARGARPRRRQRPQAAAVTLPRSSA